MKTALKPAVIKLKNIAAPPTEQQTQPKAPVDTAPPQLEEPVAQDQKVMEKANYAEEGSEELMEARVSI